MLQVDLGTDKRTCTDRAVQWEQRSQELETVSKETLLDAVKAILTERSPSATRTERADRVARPAVGPKCGPEHTGRMTRKGKGSTDKKQGNSKVARTPSEFKGTADTVELEGEKSALSSPNHDVRVQLLAPPCTDDLCDGKSLPVAICAML